MSSTTSAEMSTPCASVDAGRLPALLAFGSAILLGASLLFLVQPVIAKMILPWFGGSSAVWIACLMFFQIVLLAGYLYAHCLVRFLSTRRQVVLHAGLLLLSFVLLPIVPAPAWRQASGVDPTLRVLMLLAATVGLPYFLLSATSPLLQSWYAAGHPDRIPYRLFAVSNFGSLAALLSFPVLIEPHLTSHAQSTLWSSAYVAFAVVCCAAGWQAVRANRNSGSEATAAADGAPFGVAQLALIALLCACSSALLLAVTNYLTQEVAPVPLLWVLPLGIYLASFVVCFQSDAWYNRGVGIPLVWMALGGMTYLLYAREFGHPRLLVSGFLVGLFICCMACHGETARRKPAARHLTRFYLAISCGGALGGMFVALLAPRIFRTYIEMPSLLVACAVLITLATWSALGKRGRWVRPLRYVLVLVCLALAVYLVHEERDVDGVSRVLVRNFYGTLKVADYPADENGPAERILSHGTTIHGLQILDPDDRLTATSYYTESSGLGLAMETLRPRGILRVGVIGLGAGVTASYCKPGDTFEFYELNPAVVEIARSQFTFLQECANAEVRVGDARRTLESQSPQQFDLLAVDAFSSDAVPVHLLTREAFTEYFRHLRPGGVLAVHITNRYLDLAPVVARNAAALHKRAIVVDDDSDDPDYVYESTWVLLSAEPAIFDQPAFQAKYVTPAEVDPHIPLWTDDYSNLFKVLK